MIVRIYPQHPNEKAIAQMVAILREGGVIIYPTDSVYAFGCSLGNSRGIEKLHKITGKQGTDFSIICPDLATIALYAKVDTPTFKLLKRNLPGPFTFILNTSSKMPDKFPEKKRTVGVRIPNNEIPLALVRELGHPLVTTSVKDEEHEEEYTTDPSLIYELYGSQIDAMIDGGYGNAEPSTVVDCTDDEPVIIREGIEELKW